MAVEALNQYFRSYQKPNVKTDSVWLPNLLQQTGEIDQALQQIDAILKPIQTASWVWNQLLSFI